MGTRTDLWQVDPSGMYLRRRGRGSILLPGTPPDPGGGGTIPTLTSTVPQSALTIVTGTQRLQTPGAVITGKRFTGDVYHEANTQIIDCEFDAGFSVSSAPQGNPSSTRKESLSALRCRFNGGIGNYGGFADVTLDACSCLLNDTQIQLRPDVGYTASNLIMRNCYWYSRPVYSNPTLNPSYDPHWELSHLYSVQGFTITNNVWDMVGAGATERGHISALINMDEVAGFGWSTGGIISGNYWYGGAEYQVMLGITNSTVSDNQFHTYTGFGQVEYPSVGRSYTGTGNTLDGVPYALAA